MPAKSKSADPTSAMVNEDAVRQRAYYLWEADGRPEGKHDHYWHLAHAEATKAFVESTATKVAKATKGKNPADIPASVKANGGKKPMKAKAADDKPAKKAATKPRAAVSMKAK